MKRKKTFILFLCIIIILPISGCQKTPNDVKEKSLKHQKAEDVKETDIKYVSVDHILDNQEKVLSKTYQNLSFQNTVHLEQPDSVSVLSLTVANPFGTKKKLADICSVFWGTDQYRKEIVRLDDLREFPGGIGVYAFNYYADNTADSARMSDNGYVALYKENAEMFTSNRQTICHVDWNENLDVVYDIGGEEVSIREAVDYVNNWCNKNWITFEPEYSYQVKTVYVCKTKQKGYYYYFDVCKVYKGMPFDDISFYIDVDNFYIRNSLDVVMEHKNELSFFRNNNNSYDIAKNEEHNDKLIGLEQAILLVQEKMTGSQKFEIADIDLKYVIRSDLTYNDLVERDIPSYVMPGCPVTARPTWSFILDYQPGREEEAGDPWPRKFINVDMISGEILYRDSI